MPRLVATLLWVALLPSPTALHAAPGWGPPVNLGSSVNSPADEYGVAIAPDGTTIYFDSARAGGEGDKDLYTSSHDGEAWSEAANLGPDVNGPLREYAPAISPDGQTLIFTSAGWNLHSVSGGAGLWAARMAIPGQVNTDAEEWGARFVSQDEIVFTAWNRPGGSGGHDLLTSTLVLGEWSVPASLDINTSASHYAPFIAPSGDSMYLALDGDIHVAYFSGTSWSTPTPVPGLVNTGAFNETSPVIATGGLRLYFTSERAGGQGGYDIWYSEWQADVVGVPEPGAPGIVLGAARPNPFAHRTRIPFDLPEAASLVRATIFDVAGRRVRTLLEGPLPRGRSHVEWDGRDSAGRALPPGTYLHRLVVDGRPRTLKLTKLH